jgi:hypothetical protein
MPSINHKRKTSKKSKSSKRSKNANRNKKTRSNMMKMSGGAEVGDLVYSKITGLLLGQITEEKERAYIIKPNKEIKKKIKYVVKPSEELDWSTIQPDPETIELTKAKQKKYQEKHQEKVEINDYVYDMEDRIIGTITKVKADSVYVKPFEKNEKRTLIFDRNTEGLYWYSMTTQNSKIISTYDLRLKDASQRVEEEKLKHSKPGNATKSIERRSTGYSTDNIDVDEFRIEHSNSTPLIDSKFETYA